MWWPVLQDPVHRGHQGHAGTGGVSPLHLFSPHCCFVPVNVVMMMFGADGDANDDDGKDGHDDDNNVSDDDGEIMRWS